MILLSEKIAFMCPNCYEKYKKENYLHKPLVFWLLTLENPNKKITCSDCGNDAIQISLTNDELYTFACLKVTNELLYEMCKLKENNIIDFQLKYNQFKNQLDQQNAIKELQNNQTQQPVQESKTTCPRCGSIDIAAGTRGFGLVTGFLGSGSPRLFCKKCGYKWKPGSLSEALARSANGN